MPDGALFPLFSGHLTGFVGNPDGSGDHDSGRLFAFLYKTTLPTGRPQSIVRMAISKGGDTGKESLADRVI